MSATFDPQTLADDLSEVRRIYARFFDTFDQASWDKLVKGSPKEWTLHETMAHLFAWNDAGLESIKHILRGETYTFRGLDTRYEFNAYNRQRIDEHLKIPMQELCAKLLDVLDQTASIARNLQPDQVGLTGQVAFYNRPVRIDETLSILIFHMGLVHSVQVTEPAGLPPLWLQLSSGFRHRVIERMMRAFSLLYRFDLGGSLRDALAFRVDGSDGGQWYVKFSPETTSAGEGVVDHPGLMIHMRGTPVLYQMVTGRLNLPLALIRGDLKLRGDLRLFLRMDTLFSVDAKPKVSAKAKSNQKGARHATVSYQPK